MLLDGDALRGGGAPSWIGALAVDPYFTAVYRLLTGWNWVFRRGLASAYGAYGPKLTPAELERWERPFRVAGTAAAFAAMLPHGLQGYTLDDLRRVQGVPVLVAWGEHDTTDSVQAGRTTAKALRAPFVLLPRAAHLSMLVDPRGVARAVERIAG